MVLFSHSDFYQFILAAQEFIRDYMSTRMPVAQVPAATADPADDPFAADEDPEMQGDFDAFTKWLNESLADAEVVNLGNPASSSTGDSEVPAGASAPAAPPRPPADATGESESPSSDPKGAAAPADHPATLPKENPAPEVADSSSGSSKPCSKCYGATVCT